MRCVLQRVDRVDIRVEDKYISGIEKGILVFLGVEQGDRESDADYLSDKIINLRIFEDERRQDGSLTPRHKGRDACGITIHAFW